MNCTSARRPASFVDEPIWHAVESLPICSVIGAVMPLRPEMRSIGGHGFDSPEKIRQVQLLIGGVQVVVGQSESHHHARNTEIPVENSDDRDRASGTDVNRLFAEGLPQSFGSGLNE